LRKFTRRGCRAEGLLRNLQWQLPRRTLNARPAGASVPVAGLLPVGCHDGAGGHFLCAFSVRPGFRADCRRCVVLACVLFTYSSQGRSTSRTPPPLLKRREFWTIADGHFMHAVIIMARHLVIRDSRRSMGANETPFGEVSLERRRESSSAMCRAWGSYQPGWRIESGRWRWTARRAGTGAIASRPRATEAARPQVNPHRRARAVGSAEQSERCRLTARAKRGNE